MARRNTRLTTVLVPVVAMSLSTAARAQTIIQGGSAAENVRSAGARAPGNMTTAGIARAQQAAQAARARVEITETPSTTPGIREMFVTELVDIMVEQINQFFIRFVNLLLERAGLPPLMLTDLLPPLTDIGDIGGLGDATDSAGTTDLGDGADGMDVDDGVDESGDPGAPGDATDSDSSDRDGGRRPGRRPARG